MSFSNRDYNRLSKAIVTDFMNDSIPLRDSLIKVADEHSLNVHETRRLLEATNTHAHLSLFKEASDQKYVEFDVVDPKDVCGELFGRVDTDEVSPHDHEKVAAYVETDHYLDLPDEHERESFAAVTKVASASVPVEEAPAPNRYAGERGFHAYAKVNKIASEMENTILELDIEYRDELDKIAHSFQSVYADDFPEFEKDANALYQDDATHIIRSVCSVLRREPSQIKTATHYVIDKPVHEKLARAVSLYKDLTDHIHGLQWYEEQAGPLLDA